VYMSTCTGVVTESMCIAERASSRLCLLRILVGWAERVYRYRPSEMSDALGIR
jgi:hypothetical protein